MFRFKPREHRSPMSLFRGTFTADSGAPEQRGSLYFPSVSLVETSHSGRRSLNLPSRKEVLYGRSTEPPSSRGLEKALLSL